MVFRPASHHSEAYATTNRSNIVEALDKAVIDEPMSVTDVPAVPMADDNLSFAQITELWQETEQRLDLPSTTGSIVINSLSKQRMEDEHSSRVRSPHGG